MTEKEFEAALTAGRKAAESRFNNRELRRWLDDALDVACDAVLAASKRHDQSIGPFGPYARSWVNRALQSLLSKRSKRAASRPTQFRLSFDFAEDGTATFTASGSGIPEDLLDKLTQLQREAITRRHVKRETYTEIARTRGVSRQAAHRVHSRAIKQLRRKIENEPG